MKKTLLNKLSVFTGILLVLTMTFSTIPQPNPNQVTDQELQAAYGQGCADDCALAAFYTALFLAGAWYYSIPAAIYTGKCIDCTSGGGGGGYCDPCSDYPGASTDEAYICEYSGGQVAGPAGCNQSNLICCYFP